jgi:hypothetical protein
VSAAAKSQSTIKSATDLLTKTSASNARLLGRIAGGDIPTFADWTQLIERNFTTAATMVTLPSAVLVPIGRKVSANRKRLA